MRSFLTEFGVLILSIVVFRPTEHSAKVWEALSDSCKDKCIGRVLQNFDNTTALHAQRTRNALILQGSESWRSPMSLDKVCVTKSRTMKKSTTQNWSANFQIRALRKHCGSPCCSTNGMKKSRKTYKTQIESSGIQKTCEQVTSDGFTKMHKPGRIVEPRQSHPQNTGHTRVKPPNHFHSIRNSLLNTMRTFKKVHGHSVNKKWAKE
jgi:hypothetical protein